MTKPTVSDENPYSPPALNDASISDQKHDAGMVWAARGAGWSVIATFPMAGLIAFAYRFPVPFAGYMSGFRAILPAMFGVIVYGVFLGGLLVVALVGAFCGVITARSVDGALHRKKRFVISMSFIVATVCVMLLAVLDKFIGPW